MQDDIVSVKDIFLILDKPRIFKFSMKSIYLLEKKYGEIGKALEILRNIENAKDYLVTLIDLVYYCIIPNMTIKEIEAVLTLEKLIEINKTIYRALELQFPSIDEKDKKVEKKNKAYDWDRLYYTGRYHLKMSDDEFWSCTLRKFLKLCDLWCIDNGIKQAESKNKVYADTINW